MPTIYVQPDPDDFAKAMRTVVVFAASEGRMARFELDGMVVLSGPDVSSFIAAWRHVLDTVERADEAFLRGVSMEQLELLEAGESSLEPF